MPYFGQNLQSGSLYDGINGRPTLRDFQHASKIFRPNGYALAPKLKFLFHVYFEINKEAYDINYSENNFGLLVKSVKLPNYNITTHELNQYNRKRIVQTKIKYENAQVTFHDDNDDTITSLWDAYYTYYYKDGTNFNIFKNAPGAIGLARPNDIPQESDDGFNSRNIYDPSDNIVGKNNWGYIGETYSKNNNTLEKKSFFKTITIFGFNRHLFTAYTLINPLITRFTHDTYNYSEGNGTMEMQMEIQYETVAYNQGAMDGREPSNIVKGFGLESAYDRTLSPITPPGAESPIPGNDGYTSPDGGFVKDNWA